MHYFVAKIYPKQFFVSKLPSTPNTASFTPAKTQYRIKPMIEGLLYRTNKQENEHGAVNRSTYRLIGLLFADDVITSPAAQQKNYTDRRGENYKIRERFCYSRKESRRNSQDTLHVISAIVK